MMAAKNRKKKNVTKPESDPIPRTIIRSNIMMRIYRIPTIFMTNMPESSVAGPLSTQGKIAGHRYVAA